MRPRAWLAAGLVLIACGELPEDEVRRTVSLAPAGVLGTAYGELSLRTISSVTLSPRSGDTLYLAQLGEPSILMLSSSGDSLATLGRGGSGPGEFQGTPWLSVLRDTLWASDFGGSLNRFSARGNLIDRIRIAPLAGFLGSPRFVAPLADGSILFQPSYSMTDAARGVVTERPLVRVDRDGSGADTLATLQLRDASFELWFSDKGPLITGDHPASHKDYFSLDPQGRWLVVLEQPPAAGPETRVRFHRILPSGDTVARSTISFSTVAMEDAWIDAWADRMAHQTTPARMRVLAREQVEWPETHPPVEASFVDNSERIWIKGPYPHPDSARWTVLDQEGKQVMETVVPRSIHLRAAVDSVVWASWISEAGVPHLLRFLLKPSSSKERPASARP